MATTLPEQSETSSIKYKINDDLLKVFKEILIKHLDERTLKEDKVNSWMNNILVEERNILLKNILNMIYLFMFIYVQEMYILDQTTVRFP